MKNLLYIDKRVYEKLTVEEKIKCGKWMGGIIDDKPKEEMSRWK